MALIAVAGTNMGRTFNVLCELVPSYWPTPPRTEVAGTGDRVPTALGESTDNFGLRPACGPGGRSGVRSGCGFGNCRGADGVRRYDRLGGIDWIGGLGDFAVGVCGLAQDAIAGSVTRGTRGQAFCWDLRCGQRAQCPFRSGRRCCCGCFQCWLLESDPGDDVIEGWCRCQSRHRRPLNGGVVAGLAGSGSRLSRVEWCGACRPDDQR